MARITYSGVDDAGPGWTRFTMPDGRQVTIRGDRAMRNNNPGNIEYGRFTRQYGAIGTDGRFAAFPTRERGILAQAGLLFGPNYRNLTLSQAIAKYAPQFENNTAAYAARVAKLSGVSLSTKLRDVPASQQKSVITAMHEVEGNTPVRSYDAQGRLRGIIDRNHPAQYQTQPNPGGFDFNNPGGFSPPHPNTNNFATADYTPRTVQNMVRPDLNEAPQSQQQFSAPVGAVERRALPAVGASSFPARPGVIAPNNTRTATPALDRALAQRGISSPSPATQPATQQTATRDPSTLSPGTYPGRVVGDGIAPTFAGQQQPALTSPTSLSSFPARPSTIAPNTRPALAAALQRAGLVTPGDPAPTSLSPSLDSQQLAPVAGVPVTTVRARPVPPTRVAPVPPRQIAPVRTQPRVVQPVQQPPQPVQPVQTPEPLGQEAFNARANPVTPGLRAADVYNGQVGSALATGGNIVSRENSWGPTTVTNKYGVTTATMPDGKQAAVGSFSPFGGKASPHARSVIGGLAGGVLGALAGGPSGGLLGGLLGRSLATNGLGGLGGSRSQLGGGGGMAGGGLGGMLGGMLGGANAGNMRGGDRAGAGGGAGGSTGPGTSSGGGGGRGQRDRSRAS